MQAKLTLCTLADLPHALRPSGLLLHCLLVFPYCFAPIWYAGENVDNLASKMGAQTRRGVTKPFIMVDLHNYVPFWAADAAKAVEGPHIVFYLARSPCA